MREIIPARVICYSLTVVATKSRHKFVTLDRVISRSPLPPPPSQSGCIYTVLGLQMVLKPLKADPNSLVTFFWISTSSPGLWLWLLDPLTVDLHNPLTVDRAVVSAQNIPHPKATSTACGSHLIQVHFGLQPCLFKPTLYSNHTRLSAGPLPVPPKEVKHHHHHHHIIIKR